MDNRELLFNLKVYEIKKMLSGMCTFPLFCLTFIAAACWHMNYTNANDVLYTANAVASNYMERIIFKSAF